MLEELLDCLGAVDDPRQAGKVEHRLVDVLAIAICAVLAGAESFEDIALYAEAKRDWPSRHLALAGGLPSHDTIRRVLMLIDPAAFEGAFLAWTCQAFGDAAIDAAGEDASEPTTPVQIAVDGKTLRRSFDRRQERTPLHLVSAFPPKAGIFESATRRGLVLAQRRVADKGGEPGVLAELLVGLELRGSMISLGAGFCHPRTAEAITSRGGGYLIALKGNCAGLHASVRDWFDAHAFAVGGRLRPCADAFDNRHGRLVRRRVFVAELWSILGDGG